MVGDNSNDKYSLFDSSQNCQKPEAKKANPIHELQDKLLAQEALIERLISDSQKKDDLIKNMEKRMRNIEANQIQTHSLMFMKDHVNKLSTRSTRAIYSPPLCRYKGNSY